MASTIEEGVWGVRKVLLAQLRNRRWGCFSQCLRSLSDDESRFAAPQTPCPWKNPLPSLIKSIGPHDLGDCLSLSVPLSGREEPGGRVRKRRGKGVHSIGNCEITSWRIDREGFRFRLLGPEGEVIAPAHPVSGFAVRVGGAGRPRVVVQRAPGDDPGTGARGGVGDADFLGRQASGLRGDDCGR